MSKHSAVNLVRPSVRRLQAYIPGEQPGRGRLTKLNTNENPYPPSPKALDAIREATDEGLRLYPNPTAEKLRRSLARKHGCDPEQILVGNGSDELLAVCIRACVEPFRSVSPSRLYAATVQYFDPSYSLYPVLADAHGARRHAVPLERDFSLPVLGSKGSSPSASPWNTRAALSLITTPNAPSGRSYPTTKLRRFCRGTEGVVVLDEAYADFASENALNLAFELPNVIVLRTFSKAYSLSSQRIGYAVGNAELLAELMKVRDSYSVNELGQVAALAALSDRRYYREVIKEIRVSREVLTHHLAELGFRVIPSETNFLLVEPPGFSAERWFEKLREQRVLVRWFNSRRVRRYLRITIGTDEEIAELLSAVERILAK